MSPSLPTARPVWVWSLPAFAIILSFLWYRKKRGSLNTDSGGAGEKTQDNYTCSQSEQEEIAVRNSSETENVLTESEAKKDKEEVIEEIFDKVDLKATLENPPAEYSPSKLAEQVEKKIDVKGIEESVSDKVIEKNIETEEAEKNSGAQEEEKEEDFVAAVEESVIPEQTQESPRGKNKCKKKMKDTGKKSGDSPLGKNKEDSRSSILEQKLAKLDLTNQCSGNETEDSQRNGDVAERDSANNSPSEVMLASPSVSGYSDTHSEGSSDSGKGCSEMLTPSRTPASGNSVSGDLPATSIYEFVIPQQLVGRLIGRHGSYVNEIKETTHASIYIKRHPDTPKLKICAVEGSQMDIESALDMIRRKFPKKRYPNVTLEQVVIAPEPQMIPIIPENMQLYLIEGINNDVILSSLMSAGHFFLQQPTHPTYLYLSRLNSCMMYCYSEPDQPTIPEGVGAGILCAAPVHNGWYRAQITNMDNENNICDVKFVDYGGYMTMPVSMLRQIRVDFVNLPFQAAECYLAGVKPANEENFWSEKAKEVVEKLAFGKVLQAQVYGYTEDGVPLIYLYTVVDDEVVLINQELVDRGLAEWLYSEPVTEEGEELGRSEFEVEENETTGEAI